MSLLNEAQPEKQILTVRQLNEAISDAMRHSFPQAVWVRGEVQRFPADAAGRTHVYFELHETGQSGAAEYQIPVSLMGWDRQRFGLGRYLDGSDPDLQLANKLEVCLECQVDFYAKFGKLSLKIVGVDKSFALGKLEALRRETLGFLKAEDLLERNARISLPELPLRVGLVTSPGSAAEQDFMTSLESSPYGFQVFLQGAKMQGEQLQAEVVRALQILQAKAIDVIVITRGGGSRADLSWFDQKELAVAIANCPVPVLTAIGHEIDQSIADLVAHHSSKTPTAVAEYLVDRLDEAAARIDQATARLLDTVAELMDEAHRRVDVSDRVGRAAQAVLLNQRVRFQRVAGRFQNLVAAQLTRRRQRLGTLETRLASRTVATVSQSSSRLDRLQMQMIAAATGKLTAASDRNNRSADRLQREALRPVQSGKKKIENLSTQARLLDPIRLLARGYTLTLGPAGGAVTSAAQLAAGDHIRTRFADGEVGSIVQPGGATTPPGTSSKGKGKKSGGKGKQENPGQKTLFR